MTWLLVYKRQALKDSHKLLPSGLKGKYQQMLDIMKEDSYRSPPPFEKLIGDLSGTFSHRVNIQYRIVYQILDEERVVKVIRMWTHYE